MDIAGYIAPYFPGGKNSLLRFGKTKESPPVRNVEHQDAELTVSLAPLPENQTNKESESPDRQVRLVVDGAGDSGDADPPVKSASSVKIRPGKNYGVHTFSGDWEAYTRYQACRTLPQRVAEFSDNLSWQNAKYIGFGTGLVLCGIVGGGKLSRLARRSGTTLVNLPFLKRSTDALTDGSRGWGTKSNWLYILGLPMALLTVGVSQFLLSAPRYKQLRDLADKGHSLKVLGNSLMTCHATSLAPLAAAMLLSGSVIAAEPVRLDPGADGTDTRLILYTDQGVVEQTVPARLSAGPSQLTLQPDYRSWQMDSLQLWTGGTNGTHYADGISWLQPPDNRDQLIAGMVGSEVEVYHNGVEKPSVGQLVYWRDSTGILQWNSGRQEVFSAGRDVMIRSLGRGSLGSNRLSPPINAGFSLEKPADAVFLSYINRDLGYKTRYQLNTDSEGKGKTLIHDALLTNFSDSDYRQASIQLASGETEQKPQGMLAHRYAASAAHDDSQSGRRGDLYYTAVSGQHDMPPRSRQKLRLSVMDNLGGGLYYEYRFYGQSQPGNRPVQGHPTRMFRFTAPADLPSGRVRVYEESSNGRLFLTGESVLEQAAAGSSVLLGQGEAYTIEVERSRLEVKQQVNQLIVSWQMIIRNRKKEMVQIRMTDEDSDLLRIDQLKGVELAEDGALKVNLPAESEKKVFFSTVYQRK